MIHDMIMAAAGVGGPVGPTDADFQNTVLLLHGDGTNGAQNNTFLDSSTNNFTITRNGNTTQGTFSPFSKPDGRWGNFFDGSGDHLVTPSNAAFTLSGDFTISAWVYKTNSGAGGIFTTAPSTTDVGVALAISSSNILNFRFGPDNTIVAIVDPNPFPLNQWVYVGATRSGNDITLYLNGVAVATGTTTKTPTTTTGYIGRFYTNVDNFYLTGYIADLKVVKGTATALTSIPTAPSTNTSGTSLLTCQSNRFIDNSSNAFAITRNGDVKVTPFSPFPITTAYDPAVNGGAGYFDGSGDWLSIARDTAFIPTTGDFTVECWIYPNSAGAYTSIGLIEAGTAADWSFETLANGKVSFFIGSTAQSNDSTATYVPGQWNHVMACRSGSTLYVGVNGSANTSTATGSLNNSQSYPLTIGADQNGDERLFPGYISGVRFVNGTALYTNTTYTVPTAPPTAIANTSLLLNYTNAGILDNTGFNALETVGNAQIDTSVKKYGTGSMEFDGTGDGLKVPGNNVLQLEGDFTIEMWAYINTAATQATLIAWGDGAYKVLAYLSNAWRLEYPSTNSLNLTGAFTKGQWVHYALTRSGTTLRWFIDGVLTSTNTVSATIGTTETFSIGDKPNDATAAMNGYIDDLRITKGIARYTTTFTPPTAAFPDIGD